MRIFIILFLFSNMLLAQGRDSFNNLNIKEDTTFISITSNDLIDDTKKKIDSVEAYYAINEKKIELMALTSDSAEPVSVTDDAWPENTIVSINVLRDEKGQIIFYAEYPFSESGDWFIAYEYFADKVSGHIYGFKRTASFFNSMCTDGVLNEKSIYFFNADFALIGKEYSLTDSNNKPINPVSCYFPYDYDYIIPKNIHKLIK